MNCTYSTWDNLTAGHPCDPYKAPLAMMRAMNPFDAVLLCNLGSPSSFRVEDVRGLPARVLDGPPCAADAGAQYAGCWSIFSFFPSGQHVPSEAYESIWTTQGSPLLMHSKNLKEKLGGQLELPVALGMSYGAPSLQGAIDELAQAGCSSVLLVPLYPQFADSTNTTCIEKTRALARKRGLEVEVLAPFFDEPMWLDAVAELYAHSIPPDAQLLLLSYHGLPEAHLRRADPTGNTCLASSDCCEEPRDAAATCYRHQCLVSAREIAKRLGFSGDQYRVSFQSRLGRAKWLSPATDQVLASLPREGIDHLAVACPGFTADNLETLEEIGSRGRETFLAAGGKSFNLVPCLNDGKDWVEGLAQMCGKGR